LWLDVDDIWEFDREGRFIQRIEELNYDQMRVINADGSIFAESKKFEYGFFKNKMDFLKEFGVRIAGQKGTQDLEGLSMNFGENLKGAMAAFRFLAENTNPEWHVIGRDNFKGGVENLLVTTHKAGFEYFGGIIAEGAAPNGRLIHDFHSHKTTMFSSNKRSNGHSGDIEFRLKLVDNRNPENLLSPNAIFGILYKGYLYDYWGNIIKGY
jgi:hypothetical protein